MKASLIFPHQLFAQQPLVLPEHDIFLLEEPLFFTQYPFHQQKIAFHRASMRAYADFLRQQGLLVQYLEAQNPLADVRQLLPWLAQQGYQRVHYVDVVDDWLEQRLQTGAKAQGLPLFRHDSPMFLRSYEETMEKPKGRMFQTDFYIQQRKQRGILVDQQGKPLGGKWSFDAENRLKYPKGRQPPIVHFPQSNGYYQEARAYVQQFFTANLGCLHERWQYPCTFVEAKAWLSDFIQQRLADFGRYEDAMLPGQPILNHSLLSPLLNVGLLTPQEVLDEVLRQADALPFNSVEGFVRQVLGWREFIRWVYVQKGREERCRNFWGFKAGLPASFYTGETGIPPLDQVIKQLQQTAYCHHIERLMVLGNFMLLCERSPDAVYQWFMEFFIDAYDWVMVPNVYGMSQFADGGLMATKPYISGSNYLMKMGHFPKGAWQAVWDGLFWRFMDRQRDFFLANPRLGMLVKLYDKMPKAQQQAHWAQAEGFLERLA
jgi:deoxyribodipyrimidine photolyase-related protein